MSKYNQVIKRKKHTLFQNLFKRPNHKAIWWIFEACLITGILSVVLYNLWQAMSAILASVCAGCITGITFYVITNLRNNEIQATKEEYESIEEHIDLTRKAEFLCMNIIDKILKDKDENYQSDLHKLKEYTDDIILYMDTMFIDSPKAIKLIKDFPPDYTEKMKTLSIAYDHLTSKNEAANKEQNLKHLQSILRFCADTKNILFEPAIELMEEAYSIEKSVF